RRPWLMALALPSRSAEFQSFSHSPCQALRHMRFPLKLQGDHIHHWESIRGAQSHLPYTLPWLLAWRCRSLLLIRRGRCGTNFPCATPFQDGILWRPPINILMIQEAAKTRMEAD